MFDFVTVLGSITDILVTEINVRTLYLNNRAVTVISLYSKLYASKLTSYISTDSHMAAVQRG